MGKIHLTVALLIIESLVQPLLSTDPGHLGSIINTSSTSVASGSLPSTGANANSTTPTSNVTHTPNAVKAWSSPNSTTNSDSNKYHGLYMYSAEMLSKLVNNFHQHATTNDPLNEQYYTYRRLGDNVWFNIERVAPYKTYMNWMISTNRITDRSEHGKSMIHNYINKAGESCAPETVFEVPDDIILSDNKNSRIQLDPVITDWFKTNENTPPEKMCNRFIGLTCSGGICGCGKDASVEYKTYTKTSADSPGEYNDGCYTKPWKSCHHLSYDANIPGT